MRHSLSARRHSRIAAENRALQFFEEVMSHNKMLEWCDRDLNKDDMHRIEAITGHGKAQLPDTMGEWEVRVQWASGGTTWNSLNLTFLMIPCPSLSMQCATNYSRHLDGSDANPT
jgi:hypothetical protein